MKCINDFSKMIFLGGGIMAERLYRQIDDIEKKLIGVMDLQEPENRIKKEFKQFTIKSPEYFEKEIMSGDVAVLVAIGSHNVPSIVDFYRQKYKFREDCLFVPNPYTTLRFCCIDDDFASEKRIPVTDKRYRMVESLFKDEESQKLYKLLIESKPYESIEDTYEIVPYNKIKDMYYYMEDYWDSYVFSESSDESSATVLDCGAYNGDSIMQICHNIPQKEIYYYAFEPLKENAEAIKKNAEFRKICKEIKVYEFGIGNTDARLSFQMPNNGNLEGGRFINNSCIKTDKFLEIRRLDGLDFNIRGQLYIKMDIEGSELSALKGAEQLIKKYKPYLAICLYHRKNDLLDIPTYLYNLMPDYRFYLRSGYHTILWAIPKE